jgi:dihydrofolate synthase/folylpolyglutamate synthase
MNFIEAKEYMTSLESDGINLGLKRIKALLKALGNPEESLRIIHVAGTNGKGSTSNYIYRILLNAGYDVGLFTTPELTSYHDKFRYNDEMITNDEYTELLTEIKSVSNEHEIKPSAFEVLTALAILFFKNKALDFVILEVGMGGLEDATNAIEKSIVSVITPISMDHGDYLGDTLEKVAMAKAGIIKKNGLVITSNKEPKILDVIRTTVEKNKGYLEIIDTESFELLDHNVFGIKFYYKNEVYQLSMAGIYQIENAILAMETLNLLRDIRGIDISEEAITSGLKDASWPGRFEMICDQPLMIIDGAHNLAGAIALKASLLSIFKNKKVLGVFSMLKDKPVDEVCRELMPFFEDIIITDIKNPRRMSKGALEAVVKQYHSSVTYESLKYLKENLMERGKAYDAVIIFGSLYMIGEFKTIKCNKK